MYIYITRIDVRVDENFLFFPPMICNKACNNVITGYTMAWFSCLRNSHVVVVN